MTTKKDNPRLDAVRKAVELLGGQRAAARTLGCSQHKIWKAVNDQLVGGVDPQLAADLHRATKGKVKKSDMRPDVFEPRKPYTRKAA